MNFVALVPMRGGSKSIPLKNLKNIAGRPLFFWSINSALNSDVFSKIVVSTDSLEIAEAVKKIFPQPQVEVLMRPPDLAQDHSSTESVMFHFADNYEFDVVTTIQVTSPLTTSRDFIEAKEKFLVENLDGLLTGCVFKRFLWSAAAEPLNYNPQARPRRQDFEGQILENGAFYMTRRQTLMERRNRLGGKIGIHIMLDETQFEIDEPSDWIIVEQLLKKHPIFSEDLKNRIKKLKALVLDVDGTLTNGLMYYGADGEFAKSFHTRDAHGLAKLQRHGIKVCLITAEDSPSVHARVRKINPDGYFYGIKNKLPVLQAWAEQNELDLDELGYMGDDEGDIQCLEAAGMSFCPADAVEAVKELALFCASKSGDNTAVREVADLILELQS